MKEEELSVGDRVLLQSGRAVKEHAQIKAFLDNGNISLKLSDSKIREYELRHILKVFK